MGTDVGPGAPTYRDAVRMLRPSTWLSAGAVAGMAVVGSFGAASGQADRRGIGALAILLLLVGPVALLLRERAPTAVALTAVAATWLFVAGGYPFGPIFLAVAVSLFWVVQAQGRRRAAIVAAVGYVGLFVALAVDDRSTDVGWLHAALVAGWLVVIVAVSEVVRVQRQHAAARAAATEEERLRRANEQRLAVAQELHDVLAHSISLINVQASVALHLLDEQPDGARPALGAIKDASHEALQGLRTALDVLRQGDAAPLAPAPRLADVEQLVEGVRSSGIDIRVERTGTIAPLPAAVEVAAYRIIQEALTNVTRHADARSATVRLHYGDPVEIEVWDDGRGSDGVPGNGIAGMGERAAALGGSVQTGRRDGGGFGVLARLPVPG